MNKIFVSSCGHAFYGVKKAGVVLGDLFGWLLISVLVPLSVPFIFAYFSLSLAAAFVERNELPSFGFTSVAVALFVVNGVFLFFGTDLVWGCVGRNFFHFGTKRIIQGSMLHGLIKQKEGVCRKVGGKKKDFWCRLIILVIYMTVLALFMDVYFLSYEATHPHFVEKYIGFRSSLYSFLAFCSCGVAVTKEIMYFGAFVASVLGCLIIKGKQILEHRSVEI